jgi:hypothetical protein
MSIRDMESKGSLTTYILAGRNANFKDIEEEIKRKKAFHEPVILSFVKVRGKDYIQEVT